MHFRFNFNMEIEDITLLQNNIPINNHPLFFCLFVKLHAPKAFFIHHFIQWQWQKDPSNAAHIFFPSFQFFFAYTFLFLKKELIRSASCITVFATVSSSLWSKNENPSLLFLGLKFSIIIAISTQYTAPILGLKKLKSLFDLNFNYVLSS